METPAKLETEVQVSRPWLLHYDAGVPQHLSYPRIPLYRLLDDTAAKTPAAPCTSFFGKRMTYGNIREASDHFAAGLQARGVRKGDRVALLLPNSPQFMIAFYGILKAGAVIVPLNPLYTERELTFHLTNSGTESIVTLPMFLDNVVPLVAQTPLRQVVCSPVADFLPFPLSLGQGFSENRMVRGVDLTSVLQFRSLLKQPLPANWQPEPVSPDDMAVLIYSGGTTGVAKGIMLSHYQPGGQCSPAAGMGQHGRRGAHAGRAAAVPWLRHERHHERAAIRRGRDRADAPLCSS